MFTQTEKTGSEVGRGAQAGCFLREGDAELREGFGAHTTHCIPPTAHRLLPTAHLFPVRYGFIPVQSEAFGRGRVLALSLQR
jgi:hypothetical protein